MYSVHMRKKGKILVRVYEALRSTGAEPERLYGLAKIHKKETSLRPVLSIPGVLCIRYLRSREPRYDTNILL